MRPTPGSLRSRPPQMSRQKYMTPVSQAREKRNVLACRLSPFLTPQALRNPKSLLPTHCGALNLWHLHTHVSLFLPSVCPCTLPQPPHLWQRSHCISPSEASQILPPTGLLVLSESQDPALSKGEPEFSCKYLMKFPAR